jgi:Adenosine deaminase
VPGKNVVSRRPHCERDLVLADLHLHFNGSLPASAVLEDLIIRRDRVRWDWYEAEMTAAYGMVPPTREVVNHFRAGDAAAAETFSRLFVFGDQDAGTYSRFQAKTWVLWAVSAVDDDMATAREIRDQTMRFARAIRRYHRSTGVTHCEIRIDRRVAALLLPFYFRGARGISEQVAIMLDRSDPWEGWSEVQQLALGKYGSALVGIDFCGNERGHPPKELTGFVAAVRAFNDEHPSRALAILYPVGESFGDKSLESAIRWVHEAAEMGAHRLGHAIALGIDPAAFGTHARSESVAERRDQIDYDLAHAAGLRAAGVRVDRRALRRELRALAPLPADSRIELAYDDDRLDQVRRRQDFALARIGETGAVLEVCPTSNRRIAGIAHAAHHPVHRFLVSDVPVVVNTDDPGIFGITLDGEFDWICDQYPDDAGLRARLVGAAWNSRSEILTGRRSPSVRSAARSRWPVPGSRTTY